MNSKHHFWCLLLRGMHAQTHQTYAGSMHSRATVLHAALHTHHLTYLLRGC